MCTIFRKDIMKLIENNAGRFFNFPMSLVDSVPPWEFHLDSLYFVGGVRQTEKNLASEFLGLLHKLVLDVGGALPLIVDNNLDENDWKTQLNNATENPLGKASLENLAESLKNIPIYVTADDKLVSVPAEVGAKVFWTLSPEQFQGRFITEPNLSKARVLVFVRCLRDLKTNLNVFRADSLDCDTRGAACRGIIGSAVKVGHELTHAARLRKSLSPKLSWIISEIGWGLSLEEMKTIATPEKFAGYRFGAKSESQFAADAGRLWEHSLTGGKAVIEPALVLVGVAVRHQGNTDSDAAKEELLSESVSNAEALDIMGDPKKLLPIMRARAMLLSANCPQGYELQTYVTCSRDMIRCAQD